MSKSQAVIQPDRGLSENFFYALEIERTSVFTGKNGSALNADEFADGQKALKDLRRHILRTSFYHSVMAPDIVKPGLEERGLVIADQEIASVLNLDPMKGSAPCVKLILDTPDLKLHRAGVWARISEKIKPSGKKIEQAVKLDIGAGNHHRLEFETPIKQRNSKLSKFEWGRLQKPEQDLLRERMQVNDLDSLDLKVWMILFGSNWQMEFMPAGNSNIVLKQKHDQYHIRDIFGWEAYICKAEIEADLEQLGQNISIDDVENALDDVQKRQISKFSRVISVEKRSIYQTRFDTLLHTVLPAIDGDCAKYAALEKSMGRRKYKPVSPHIISEQFADTFNL